MNGLDTNAVVRFLVRDDEKQAQAVRSLLIRAEKKGDVLFVPLAVTLETIWVLSSAYGYAKEQIVEALEALLVLPVLSVEEHERIAQLCRIAGEQDAGLGDLLIGLTSRDNGCDTTLTFDRKAARSELFSLID